MSARTATILVLVAAGAAYAFGWWPQRQNVARLEDAAAAQAQKLTAAEARAAAAEATVRLAGLLGQSLALGDAVARGDFPRAEALSTAFFNGVQAEMMAGVKEKADLEQVLGLRDQVTAALARRDPAATLLVRRAQERLRRALGYAVEPLGPIDTAMSTPAAVPAAPAGVPPAATTVPRQ
jgi:hypothetical protein